MVQKTENMTVAEQVKIVIAETTKKLLEIAKQQKMDSGFVIWLGNQALKQELTKYENIQMRKQMAAYHIYALTKSIKNGNQNTRIVK